jgi:broad specificity phosphatase PhoE
MAEPTPLRRIFLVRHGETLYGGRSEGALPGSDLTDRGYKQIEALAALLESTDLDAVYTSPLGRTQATARTLIASRDIPIVTVDDLREIVPGDVSGREMAQIFAAVRAFFADPTTDWDTPYLGGETYRQLRERVWPFFADLLARDDWRRVAVVAHGGVNNAVLGRVLGHDGPTLANVEQDFGCLNILDVLGDRPLVRLLNFTAYDPLKCELETPSIDVLRRLLEAGFQVALGDAQG